MQAGELGRCKQVCSHLFPSASHLPSACGWGHQAIVSSRLCSSALRPGMSGPRAPPPPLHSGISPNCLPLRKSPTSHGSQGRCTVGDAVRIQTQPARRTEVRHTQAQARVRRPNGCSPLCTERLIHSLEIPSWRPMCHLPPSFPPLLPRASGKMASAADISGPVRWHSGEQLLTLWAICPCCPPSCVPSLPLRLPRPLSCP